MRHTLLIIVLIFVTYFVITNTYVNNQETIRLRIIANSNTQTDQDIKENVRLLIQGKLSDILKNSDSISSARFLINSNLDSLNLLVEKITPYNYSINYGLNYFPEKEHQGIIYPEGYYESVLVTLGEGSGDNFWCLLYPSQCFLDKNETIKYKSWFKEIVDKI